MVSFSLSSYHPVRKISKVNIHQRLIKVLNECDKGKSVNLRILNYRTEAIKSLRWVVMEKFGRFSGS